MIRVEGLRRRYAETEVLRGFSFAIAPGEMVALSGPSGAGKSTLLQILGGLDRGYEGRVEVAGRDLSRMSDRELAAYRNLQVGFVFQSFNLIAGLSTLENVLLPVHFGRGAERPDRARAEALLARVGLGEKARRLPSELSGGERQRVALARALLFSPKLVLADEPTGALDEENARAVIGLLRDLCREEGITAVIASHERAVWEAADRKLHLRGGALEVAA